MHYRSGAKNRTIVQYLLLFLTIFEVLEGPIHEGHKLGQLQVRAQ
jgi:hypothetical protein